jgi:hypothetical protein
MSSTAQGVTAVKQCRFPPRFGYNTDVSHGAVKVLSTVNFANLTAKDTHPLVCTYLYSFRTLKPIK